MHLTFADDVYEDYIDRVIGGKLFRRGLWLYPICDSRAKAVLLGRYAL